jgi:hypothetical protein
MAQTVPRLSARPTTSHGCGNNTNSISDAAAEQDHATMGREVAHQITPLGVAATGVPAGGAVMGASGCRCSTVRRY